MSPGDTARFTVRRFKPDVVRDCAFYRNKADHWYTPLSPLTFLVAPAGTANPLPLHEENSHRFKVVNDSPDGLHAAATPQARQTGRYRIRGYLLDRYNHVLGDAKVEPATAALPADGTHALDVRESQHGFAARIDGLNPDPNPRSQRPFWGDLHGHSLLSDGVGPVDEYYPYARDVAGLDFCALGEHVCYLTDIDLHHLADLAARHLDEGRFVTIFGYEWAGHGGHRCIYTDREWMDPIRGMDSETDTLDKVWAILDRSDARHLVSAHSLLGMPAMHQYAANHNPRYERYVEAYTRGGGSEVRDNPLLCSTVMQGQQGLSYRELMAQGIKVAFAGAGDNHETMPGLTVRNWAKRNRGGLVGVWADCLSRASIFTALQERCCFATTGQKASMWLEVNGSAMGQECDLGSGPNAIRVVACATAPIKQLDVFRDGEAIHTGSDLSESVDLEIEDSVDQAAYYYFRIIQQDGNWAWSSPVFSR